MFIGFSAIDDEEGTANINSWVFERERMVKEHFRRAKMAQNGGIVCTKYQPGISILPNQVLLPKEPQPGLISGRMKMICKNMPSISAKTPMVRSRNRRTRKKRSVSRSWSGKEIIILGCSWENRCKVGYAALFFWFVGMFDGIGGKVPKVFRWWMSHDEVVQCSFSVDRFRLSS